MGVIVSTSFDDNAARMVEQKVAKVVALGIEAGLLAQARRTEKRKRLEGLERGQALGDGDGAAGDRHRSADPRDDLEDGRARGILEAQLARQHAAQHRHAVLVLRRVIERAERRRYLREDGRQSGLHGLRIRRRRVHRTALAVRILTRRHERDQAAPHNRPPLTTTPHHTQYFFFFFFPRVHYTLTARETIRR